MRHETWLINYVSEGHRAINERVTMYGSSHATTFFLPPLRVLVCRSTDMLWFFPGFLNNANFLRTRFCHFASCTCILASCTVASFVLSHLLLRRMLVNEVGMTLNTAWGLRSLAQMYNSWNSGGIVSVMFLTTFRWSRNRKDWVMCRDDISLFTTTSACIATLTSICVWWCSLPRYKTSVRLWNTASWGSAFSKTKCSLQYWNLSVFPATEAKYPAT